MTKKSDGSMKVAELRLKAEELFRVTKRDVAALSLQDVQQLVYELQVHQIELDMQNEELRRAQTELEAARDRYATLYDFSPTGHLTLNTSGTIVESNLRAAALLGLNRGELIGQPLARFVESEDQALLQRHCQEVVKTGTRQTCEVQFRNTSGVSCWLYLESLAMQEEPGRMTHWWTAMLDVTDRKRAEEAFRFAKFSMDRAADAVYWIDPQAKILNVNEAASLMLGYSKDELCAMTVHDLNPDFQADMWPGFLEETRRRGKMVFETSHRGKDGRLIPIEVSVNHLAYEGKEYHCAFVRDITTRRRAEEALQASDTFARTILNSLSAHICVLDRDGFILKTNDAWREFAQQHVGNVFTLGKVGDNYLDCCRHIIAADMVTSQAILKGIEAVLTGDQSIFSAEYPVLSPEVPLWFLMRVTPLKESQGVVISHTDISERVRMAGLLEQHILLLGEKREELEFLTGKLIEAQEEERKRIARDLHDDFNQRLAALSVELEGMERTHRGLPKPVARQLAAIRSQVVQLSDDLHDLAYKLHPSLLEHVGLELALRDHAAEFTKRTGLAVAFDVRKVPVTLSPDIATNLFRVMQESLQNVSKHAQATEVTVRLSGSSKGIGLSVRDNGKGFKVLEKNPCAKGLGLMSMQERARGLGGFLRIHSWPRAGTKVCVWIPLSQEDA